MTGNSRYYTARRRNEYFAPVRDLAKLYSDKSYLNTNIIHSFYIIVFKVDI